MGNLILPYPNHFKTVPPDFLGKTFWPLKHRQEVGLKTIDLTQFYTAYLPSQTIYIEQYLPIHFNFFAFSLKGSRLR